MVVDFWQAYFWGLAAVMSLLTIGWLVSLWLRDSSIIDVFWGLGFVLACYVYHLCSDAPMGARNWLIVALVTIWGLRLSIHIFIRNHGKPEDYRYQEFRRAHGDSYWWQSLIRVFWLQGALLWIISAPLAIIATNAQYASLGLFDLLVVVLWGVGFYFEAMGDWQLQRFKADPGNQGKVMDQGLWSLSRHPNYFGDAVQWWAFFLLALPLPFSLFTVFAPVLMTVLLLRVSGVALLEQNLTKTKPKYADYIARTPAFVPRLWPKKN